MSKCPNFENPEVLADFKEIDDATYPDFAWVVWDKNNGHNIDKAPNGEDSILFNDLLEYFNGDRASAIRAKSEIYSDLIHTAKDNLDKNGEPPIKRLDNFLPKKPGIDNTKIKLIDFEQFTDYSDSVIAPGSKSVLRTEGLKKFYNENLPPKSNKRFVANTFFRYNINSKWSNRTEPYYPFRRSLSMQENLAYVDYINSAFNQPVVELNKDGIITFLPKIEDAKRTNINKDFVSNEPVEQIEGVSGVEEVDVSHIDTAIDRIYKRKLILEKRARQGKDNPEMKANISSMKKQIDKLEDEKKALVTPDILEDLASQDSKVISNNLDNIQSNLDNSDDLSGEQLLNMLDSLVESSYTIKGWVDIQEVLQDIDVVSEDRLAKIAGEYSKLNIKYNNLLAELFAEYANQETQFTNLSKDKILDAVSDISDAKKLFFGLSDTGIPLLQVVDDVIKKAAFEINKQSEIKKNQLEKEVDKITKAGYKQSEVSEIFKQLDSDGNWTGNIITEISHDYHVEKNKLLKEAKKKGSWKKYYNWIKDNSVQLDRKQLQDVFKGDYTAALEAGFTKEDLDVQKSLIAEYEAEKKAYREVVEFKYGDNPKAIEDDMNNWQRANSPLLYVQGQLNDGHRYLIKEKPDVSKWADKGFDKIKNDKALSEFYSYMKKTFDENNSRIGYFNDFDVFYLPELESSLLERTKTQKNLWKKTTFLGRTLLNSFTDELQNVNENTVDIRGRTIKSVPIQMMNNRIAPALKEDNIFKVLESHTNMSLNYQYKTEIEPMTNAATDLLDAVKEIEEVDIDGTKVAQRVRDFISEKEGKLFNAKKLLEYAKDAHLYNQRKKVEGRIKKVKTKELGVNEKGKVVDEVVEKDVTASSFADNLITYTYLKAMSIPNVVTPAVNMLFGTNANLIYAAGGQDVTTKNMNKALLEMTSITARSFGAKTNHELSQKVFAFMSKFQLLGAIHDTDYGKGVSPTEIATILQSKAEHFNQGALMLGMLHTHKIKNDKGQDVSVLDAYKVENGTLVWDTDKMGEKIEVSENKIFHTHKRGINLRNFGLYVDKVNSIVHGDYKSPMMAKETSVGRLLMLFKTWLPQAVNHRFGAKFFEYNLLGEDGRRGRFTKGRYRSFSTMETLDGHDVLIGDTIKMILKGVVSRKAFNELSEVDRVNMLRNMQEIKHIAAIYLMIALLKGALMDEDDDFKPGLNLAINTLTKTSSDLSFFISPNSASQVLDNLVSVTSTLKDVERAIGAVYKTVQGDWEVKSGPQKGQTRVGVGMARTIPGFSGGLKMWNLGSKVIDY